MRAWAHSSATATVARQVSREMAPALITFMQREARILKLRSRPKSGKYRGRIASCAPLRAGCPVHTLTVDVEHRTRSPRAGKFATRSDSSVIVA